MKVQATMALAAAHLLLVLILAPSVTSSTATSHSSRMFSNKTEEEPLGTHSQEKPIQLVSWRWEEFADIFLLLVMLIITALVKVFFHNCTILSRNIPESCMLILIGTSIGWLSHALEGDGFSHFPAFNNHLFFYVLLPPIVLDAAFSLYDYEFLHNIGSVLTFAVVGTLFNTFSIGVLLWVFVQKLGWGVPDANFTAVYKNNNSSTPESVNSSATWGSNVSREDLLELEDLTLIDSLIFSSLISAVDPVAVLAIFEEIGVNMGLYFIIFGESLLNDGVTIVLYNTMVALGSQQSSLQVVQVFLAALSFFTVVFGGLAIGLVMGGLTSIILKKTGHVRVMEPLLIVLLAYTSYVLAEMLHWSGIISLIAAGIVQKRYALLNASKKTYTTVKYAVRTMSSISDCIIFLFLGQVTANVPWVFHPGFIIWTLVLCSVVRLAGVLGLSALVNQYRSRPLTIQEQIILAYGGLRGAIAFSLAYIVDGEVVAMKQVFLTTTLLVIFFTVFVQGGTIKFVVQWLHITLKGGGDRNLIVAEINKKIMHHVSAGIEAVAGSYSATTWVERIEHLDAMYLQPLLVSKNADNKLALKCNKIISLDEHYARLFGPAMIIGHKDKVVTSGEKVPPDQSQITLDPQGDDGHDGALISRCPADAGSKGQQHQVPTNRVVGLDQFRTVARSVIQKASSATSPSSLPTQPALFHKRLNQARSAAKSPNPKDQRRALTRAMHQYEKMGPWIDRPRTMSDRLYQRHRQAKQIRRQLVWMGRSRTISSAAENLPSDLQVHDLDGPQDPHQLWLGNIDYDDEDEDDDERMHYYSGWAQGRPRTLSGLKIRKQYDTLIKEDLQERPMTVVPVRPHPHSVTFEVSSETEPIGGQGNLTAQKGCFVAGRHRHINLAESTKEESI